MKMRNMHKRKDKKCSIETNCSDQIAMGKWVQVISNASYNHFRKIGRVVEFTKKSRMAYVYFSDENKTVRFYNASLFVLN